LDSLWQISTGNDALFQKLFSSGLAPQMYAKQKGNIRFYHITNFKTAVPNI
jgi:hypothetical protein